MPRTKHPIRTTALISTTQQLDRKRREETRGMCYWRLICLAQSGVTETTSWSGMTSLATPFSPLPRCVRRASRSDGDSLHQTRRDLQTFFRKSNNSLEPECFQSDCPPGIGGENVEVDPGLCCRRVGVVRRQVLQVPGTRHTVQGLLANQWNTHHLPRRRKEGRRRRFTNILTALSLWQLPHRRLRQVRGQTEC